RRASSDDAQSPYPIRLWLLAPPRVGREEHLPDGCAGKLFPGSVCSPRPGPIGETSLLTRRSPRPKLRSCRCDSSVGLGPGTLRFVATTAPPPFDPQCPFRLRTNL